MLKIFFKIAVRSILKQKGYTIINVGGLTLGLSVCLLIYLYVKEEVSFDKLHRNTENVYRLLRIGSLNGEPYKIAITSSPFAEALVNDFPQEIENTTRILRANGLVSFEDKSFIEDKLMLADSNFFDFFSFPLELGDPNSVLDLPNSIILTKETAEKYFGKEDPINKVITVDNQLEFIVTGVFAPIKEKSHHDFDLVGNIAPLRQLGFMTNWWSNGYYTYLRLVDGTSAEAVEAQLPAFMDKYFGDDFVKMDNRIDLTLQAFGDIYFDTDVRYDEVLHGNKDIIYLFIVIGGFIFLIACINYTNLATAKSEQRAKEVGVRKTLGSSKRQLAIQFFLESLIVVSAAVMLSFTVVEIMLPTFNVMFELDLVPERNPLVLVGLATGLIVITGLMSGLYPSIILSSLRPLQVLKGKQAIGKSRISLRKVLVVLQFSISVFMIVFTLIVYQQMKHINHVYLGFDKDEIVFLELNYNTINQQIDAFKNVLQTHDGIKSITLSSGHPGGFHDTHAVKVQGLENQPRFSTLFTDESFISTYGLNVAAGRNFSKDHGMDKDNALMLNERAVRELGWTNEEAIGKQMYLSSMDSVYRNVIGVVKDYHFSSLKYEVEPLIIDINDWTSLMSIKLKAGTDANVTLDFIESEWMKIVPFKPEIVFLNDSLNDLYQSEKLQSRLFIFFASISIFIASMGVFGLASFTAVQRKKEIGIRKVLGASVVGISRLLTGDYVKLILIANLIAWPLSYYAANQWLTAFSSRIPIGIEVFLIAMCMALGIAISSVIFQALNAAFSNPVDSLKEE